MRVASAAPPATGKDAQKLCLENRFRQLGAELRERGVRWVAGKGSRHSAGDVNRHGQVLPRRLSGEGVAMVVKRYIEKLGYDPARFAAHSLRAGLATSAAAGKSERAIMNQTGHRSLTTLRRYIRDGNLFRENAVGDLGLNADAIVLWAGIDADAKTTCPGWPRRIVHWLPEAFEWKTGRDRDGNCVRISGPAI